MVLYIEYISSSQQAGVVHFKNNFCW